MSSPLRACDPLLAAVKPEWRPLLAYVGNLRRRSLRPATPPLPEAWEEIGPGYCYGPAFGHWDAIHQILDAVDDDPGHARRQLLNYLAAQQPDGQIAGSLWLRGDGRLDFSRTTGHPPVWPAAVEAYLAARADEELLARASRAAGLQIAWFQAKRQVPDGGFFYSDLTERSWESGIDEGVRFDDAPRDPATCIDATCHVAYLARSAASWARRLGRDATQSAQLADELDELVRDRLWSPETSFFHDAWSVRDPARRRLVHEGFWPLMLGIASAQQATGLIDQHLLDPATFLTCHPLPSVAISEPAHELRMWRGPTWNSITMWAARGCIAYQRPDAARIILERALDATAAAFVRTGCIWEFYHPNGGDPSACRRKPHTAYNAPCRDYLGHNPLRAMARMFLGVLRPAVVGAACLLALLAMPAMAGAEEAERWIPATVSWEVEPGSALDLSALTPAPLPGRLQAGGPHLTLADGTAVRLLGTNLCSTANFPDRALAERLASGLRRMGCNAVRFHHHDDLLWREDGTLDPERMERLDWLAASCARQGIWFTTDLYVSRRIARGAIPELPDRELGQNEFKALIPLLPSAQAEWLRFASAFLGHRNPHSGLI